MRAESEIQAEHDRILAIVGDGAHPDANRLGSSVDLLCWVLQHPYCAAP